MAKIDKGPFAPEDAQTLADVTTSPGNIIDDGEKATLAAVGPRAVKFPPGYEAYVPKAAPGAPWYRLTGQAFIDGRLYESGDVVQFAGPPNLVMVLIEDEDTKPTKPKRKASRLNDASVI